MALRTFFITVASIGVDTGPFTISDGAGQTYAGVSRAALVAGYSNTFDDAATNITITSTGACTNSLVIPILAPTPNPTATAAPTPAPTATPTQTPAPTPTPTPTIEPTLSLTLIGQFDQSSGFLAVQGILSVALDAEVILNTAQAYGYSNVADCSGPQDMSCNVTTAGTLIGIGSTSGNRTADGTKTGFWGGAGGTAPSSVLVTTNGLQINGINITAPNQIIPIGSYNVRVIVGVCQDV